VNMIGDGSDLEIRISGEEYSNFKRYQEALNYGLNMIRAVGKPLEARRP